MSRQRKYRAIVFFSALSSAGGIFLGVVGWIKIENANRGGAIAVALAFLTLFVRSDYGARLQAAINDSPQIAAIIETFKENSAPTQHDQQAKDHQALKTQVVGLTERLKADAASQARQNRALTWASVIGTLIWGFGDLFACQIQKVIAHIR